MCFLKNTSSLSMWTSGKILKNKLYLVKKFQCNVAWIIMVISTHLYWLALRVAICGISTCRYRHLTTSFCLLVWLCLSNKIHRQFTLLSNANLLMLGSEALREQDLERFFEKEKQYKILRLSQCPVNVFKYRTPVSLLRTTHWSFL